MNLKIFIKILLLLLLIIIAEILISKEKNSDKIEICQKKLQKAIINKIKKSNEFIEISRELYNKNLNDISKLLTFVNNENADNGLFVYKNDTLIFWSNNSVNPINNNSLNPKCYKLHNGWYLVNNKLSGEYNFVYAQLIKKEYNYQNEYLENQFQKEIKIPANIGLSLYKGIYNIYDTNHNLLFSIQLEKSKQFNEFSVFSIFLIYLLAFIIFLSILIDLYKKLPFFNRNQGWLFLALFADVVLIRWVVFYFQIPNFLNQTKLFSPFYYASLSLLPSLGDLIVNVVIIGFIAIIFYRTKVQILKFSKRVNLLIGSIFTFLIFVILFKYSLLFKSLIIDSSISLTLNNPLSPTFLSVVILLLIALLNISLVLIVSKLIKLIYQYNQNKLKYIIYIFLFTTLITLLIFNSIVFKNGLLILLFSPLFAISAFIIENPKFELKKVYYYGIYVVIFSIFASIGFNQFNQQKEREKRKLLMQKMALENDPMSEYLFGEVYNKIKNDSILNDYIKTFTAENEIINYLKYKYFKGYWSKYNTQITVCKDFQNLLIKPSFGFYNCDRFFYDKITKYGMPTMTENLFLLNDNVYENSYLSLIRLFEHSVDSMLRTSIYIELNAKFIIKDLGYPELLIDKKANTLHDISTYSYARYHKGVLYKNYGKSKYYNTIDYSNYKEKTYYFINYDGYDHLIFRPNNSSLLIISLKKQGIFEFFLPFSFLILFFTLILIIFLVFFGNLLKFKFSKSSFKLRLQLSIITILLISFFLVGVSTLIYISSFNNEKHREVLTEKAHSALVKLETELGVMNEIDISHSEAIYDILVHLSNIFFTDINLYDTKGNLVASSRSQIFEENLISDKLNPVAYYELYFNGKNIFINKEKIGKYEYMSAYIPFKNVDNKLLAFLNLPYFAKQNEIKREISTFLTTYLNIYIFLIFNAILIAIFISNYITRPLRLIKEKMSQIKLGNSNEKIEWFRNDEIGSLINDYNSMIDQIASSAEMLAKSEREQAWREMAKQVAHEIKNPLTPMKLSIQHLQKAWNDRVDDWDERLNRFSNTLIEQIDSLSEIASEFSDFAKFTSTNFSRLNLSETLQSTVNLFISYVDENINITTKIEEDSFIYADKKQMLQVFNNLIKNALHAVQNNVSGIIEIELLKNQNNILVAIRDNGKGIEEKEKDKIFSPNFTTKSSGMGLGLAIVKSIIETNNGEIWFESEVGVGTVFYLKFTQI